MNELTISGVKCYIDGNGTSWLNLEDVARGLGFTTVATSGNECVRWARVEKYLTELGFNENDGYLPDTTFIPENIFYLLAMKASNSVAMEFQKKVANEILPSIRKHGAYMTDDAIEKAITDPDFLIRLATELKEEKTKRITAENKIESDKPKVLFADAVSSSKTSILIGELAKILRQNGIEIGQNRLFEELRNRGYLIKRSGSDWNMPTQRSMELGLFEIKEHTHIDGNGCNITTKTAKVTGKGQQYFINKFLTA